jgi:nickel/cobalt transporter (NicO) family protein
MKRIFQLIILTMFLANLSFAHPLGNFSINQFSRLEIDKNQIQIKQILDMAEIPTFQATAEIDSDKNNILSTDELNNYAENLTAKISSNLLLAVNGENLPLRFVSKTEGLKEGAGNLNTLRIEWHFVADSPKTETNTVVFENKNFAERIGWKEIVVNRGNLINIFDSNVFGNTLSDELKNYPENLLTAPLTERKAEFSYTTNTLSADAKILQNRDGQTSAIVQKDKLAELITLPEITPSIILFGLLLAFGLGAMHALSPGHGKTVVGAYLVGSRGTSKHAIFLGLVVTITHTLGVFALGIITIFLSNYLLPEKLMPMLNFVSGLLVFFIGISLFKDRLFGIFGWNSEKHSHSHDHHTNDEHTHHHADGTHTHGGSTHSHALPEAITWKNLLALGVSGGLLPCPSALVLMLSAISLGRTGYGIILTLFFSLGLATTLTAIGLIFLNVGKFFGNSAIGNYRFVKALPVLSAFVIACLGAVICYNSIG